jgi:hypothetical protein
VGGKDWRLGGERHGLCFIRVALFALGRIYYIQRLKAMERRYEAFAGVLMI